MENIRFDFSDFHQHGHAFYEFLQLRKKVFVDAMKWDVPHNDAVEMDQYDTPVAHYSLVLRDGVVVGGARTMATTAVWGEHTYMLRDAWSGKLPHIPRHVMSVEIASPEVWECTRLVISDSLVSQVDRSTCLALVVDGLVEMARARGATTLISLSPVPFLRAMRQLGYDVSLLGEAYRSGEDGRQYGVMRMPAEYSHMRKALTQHPAVVRGFASRRYRPAEYDLTEAVA
ncbi:MAG: GNAT family N-acetyltransferase [Candidatus Saccharibacteria bacterium]|nr:GNAT family N-acetyltransferase [Pseudorhodobacter sp.]